MTIFGNCRLLYRRTISVLPTIKRRDYTRREHLLHGLRVKNTLLSLNQGNFSQFCLAVSFTLVDLKFLVL